MTVDEAARLHLHEQARDSMDDDAAKTLLTGLPWDVDRVAGKDDVRRACDRLFWQMCLAMIAINGTFLGCIALGVQLAR
jgi:hypothetical protein